MPLEIYDQPLGGPEFSGDREWRSPSPRGVALGRRVGACAVPGGRAVCVGCAGSAQAGAVSVPCAQALALAGALLLWCVLLVIFSRVTRLDFSVPLKSLNTWPTSLNLARLYVSS